MTVRDETCSDHSGTRGGESRPEPECESLRPTLTDQCLSSRCHLFRAVQPSEEAWPCDHSMHLGQGYSLDLSHSTLRESMRQAENCVSLKLSEYLLKKLFEAQ